MTQFVTDDATIAACPTTRNLTASPGTRPITRTRFEGKRTTPKARERVWTLVRDNRRIDAELLNQGEAGVEVQFILNGELARSWRFPSRAGALGEADAQRARLLSAGWTAPD